MRSTLPCASPPPGAGLVAAELDGPVGLRRVRGRFGQFGFGGWGRGGGGHGGGCASQVDDVGAQVHLGDDGEVVPINGVPINGVLVNGTPRGGHVSGAQHRVAGSESRVARMPVVLRQRTGGGFQHEVRSGPKEG